VKLDDLTAYRDLNTLLNEWVQGLNFLIGDKIVGLCLAGALSYGDFVRERSIIDVIGKICILLFQPKRQRRPTTSSALVVSRG